MNNDRMEKGYLEWAGDTIGEAESALAGARYHLAVRRSQECVEMAVKGVLRLISIEFPKLHDVGSLLITLPIEVQLPDWFRSKLDFIAATMKWLGERRGPAMYGDEEKMIPPTELFDLKTASRAVTEAKEVLDLCRRFSTAWREAKETFNL